MWTSWKQLAIEPKGHCGTLQKWPTLHCLNPTMFVLSWPFHISTTSAHLTSVMGGTHYS